MAARRTAKVRIEGEDALTPITKRASRSVSDFVRSLLGLETATRDVGTATVELADDLEEVESKSKSAARATDSYTDSTEALGRASDKTASDVSQASKQVDESSKSAGRADSAFKSFGDGLRLVSSLITGAVLAAFVRLASSMQDFVRQAAEAETSLEKVRVSLEQTSSASGTTAEAIREWAESLESSIAVEKEVIEQGFVLAQSFGATEDAAKRLVATAADFATSADLNFTEAIRRLGRAMQGSTDDVAKFAPEIRNLTTQQLRAGAATDAISARFEGSAARAASTYLGVLEKVRLAQEGLTEAVGKAQIESDKGNSILEQQIALYGKLQKQIENGGATLSQKLLPNFEGLENQLLRLAIAINEFNGFSAETTDEQEKQADAAKNLAEELAKTNREINAATLLQNGLDISATEATASLKSEAEAFKILDAAARRSSDASERFIQQQNELIDAAARLGFTLEGQLNQELRQNEELLRRVEDGYRSGSISLRDYERFVSELRSANADLTRRIQQNVTDMEAESRAAEKASRSLEKLSEGTEDAARASDGIADSVDEAGGSFGSLTGSVDAATEANRRYAESASAVVAAAEQIDRKLAFTRRVFDEIAAASGRAAAIQAAIDAGGTLELGGTRLRLPGPGGGSVLTSAPGLTGFTEKTTGFNVGGGTFTVQGATASSYASAAPVLRRKV